MPTFSKSSLDKLATVDRKLYDICIEVLKELDITILVGHRNQQDQNIACASGRSRTPWPTSKHNSSPSQAVDVAPYPIDWNDTEGFKKLNDLMQAAAQKLGYNIKWGGDFTTLSDKDHWELEQS